MIRSVSPEHVLKSETYTMVFLWCKFFLYLRAADIVDNHAGSCL